MRFCLMRRTPQTSNTVALAFRVALTAGRKERSKMRRFPGLGRGGVGGGGEGGVKGGGVPGLGWGGGWEGGGGGGLCPGRSRGRGGFWGNLFLIPKARPRAETGAGGAKTPPAPPLPVHQGKTTP